MVMGVEDPPVVAPLAALAAAVDAVTGEDLWRCDDQALVDHLDAFALFGERIYGAQLRVINEVARRGTVEREQGWSIADRLAATLRQTISKARATTLLAADLGEPGAEDLLEATCDGRVTSDQARAICQVIKELPDEAGAADRDAVQAALIAEAGQCDATTLRQVGNAAVEQMFPEQVDAKLAERLERDAKRAARKRFLSFRAAENGCVDFTGRLPVGQGERFKALIAAYSEEVRRQHAALDAVIDPEHERPTPTQRRADGLVAMMDDLDARGVAPEAGGDRPTATIVLDYDALVSGLRGAELLGTGETMPPGAARVMACSGNIVPVVLGGAPVPLDVGRSVRLFTGGLRRALVVRDRGCCFPGCDVGPARTDAHHIIPWWQGGETTPANGVLLCPHHHHLLEPDPRVDQATRWTVRLDARGRPEVIPPYRVDPARRPRQHARFRVSTRPATGADPP